MAEDLNNLRRQSTTRRVFTEAAPAARLQSPDLLQVNVPFFKQANMWEGIAEQTAELKTGIEREQAAEKVLKLSQIENQIDMKALELRDKYAFDPDGFKTAYDEASAEIIGQTEGVYHPELRIALDKQYVQSATILQNETRTRNLDLTKNSLKSKSDTLAEQLKAMAFSGQAGSDLYKSTAAEYKATLRTQAGLGFIHPDMVDQELGKLGDQAKGEAVMGMLDAMYAEKGPEATQQFFDSYINDPSNGRKTDERETLRKRVKARISEKLSASARATAQQVSNYELQIEKNKRNPKALNELMQTIDQELSPVDPVKGNETKKKILSTMDSYIKEEEDITVGSLFALGSAYLNPADSENVKKYNLYFEKDFAQKISGLPPEERNTRIVNLVNKTKVFPNMLKGDIQNAARSLDVNQVALSADLINRLENSNPHLLQDIPEKDLARIRMVDQRIAAGYTPEEAFKQTDALLAPANAEMVTQRKEYLSQRVKDKKLDYGQKAIGNFRAGFFGRALPGDSGSVDSSNAPIVGNATAQLTADYRRAYESHYELTGDERLAEQHANQIVKGIYGATTVNGFNQLMRYAPEKYYGIENVDNGWMRKQAVEYAQSANPDINEKDIIIAPHPAISRMIGRSFKVTDPKTGVQRNANGPLYTIMRKTKSGILERIGDMDFDPGAIKNQMIDEARRASQAKKNANPVILPGGEILER